MGSPAHKPNPVRTMADRYCDFAIYTIVPEAVDAVIALLEEVEVPVVNRP